MSNLRNTLDSPIEYLKGVGTARADLLKTEMRVFTFRDLLYKFPFRYVDKSTFQLIKDLHNDGVSAQLKGTLVSI